VVVKRGGTRTHTRPPTHPPTKPVTKHMKLQIRMSFKTKINPLTKTQPIVKHMKLQIRMNLKTRCVELRTRYSSRKVIFFFHLYQAHLLKSVPMLYLTPTP